MLCKEPKKMRNGCVLFIEHNAIIFSRAVFILFSVVIDSSQSSKNTPLLKTKRNNFQWQIAAHGGVVYFVNKHKLVKRFQPIGDKEMIFLSIYHLM